MRSRNNNFKAKNVTQNVLRGLGISSTGILVLLGIIAISPITNKADAANGWDEELKNYRETASTVTLSMDSGTNSVVNAGNTNTNVGVVKRTASVTLGNTNGYSVYIRANSANLTGSNASNTIPSVTGNSTLSQMTDKWGWNGNVGDSVTDCSLSDVFKQMTTSNQTLGSGGAVSSGTKKVTMCFGTRVSEAKVADTYSNTVTLSVVAEPGRTAAFDGITNMQQMTTSICSAAPYHETAQLTDARDGKKYWVTKMLDGNCWMSQNLDFDITTSNVTAATSDVTSNWTANSTYPARATATSVTTGDASNTGTYSWDMGLYVVSSPTSVSECTNQTGLAACSNFTDVSSRTASKDPNFYQKSSYLGTDDTTACTKSAQNVVSSTTSGVCAQYDAHFSEGNLYQWTAATAGTGGNRMAGKAAGSVCPKNWRLPDAGPASNNTSGSFYYLLQQYGLVSSTSGTSTVNGVDYNATLPPLSFVRGGFNNRQSGWFTSAGIRGVYWSSRTIGDVDASGAYSLYIHSATVKPSDSLGRHLGYAIRCLVPTS